MKNTNKIMTMFLMVFVGLTEGAALNSLSEVLEVAEELRKELRDLSGLDPFFKKHGIISIHRATKSLMSLRDCPEKLKKIERMDSSIFDFLNENPNAVSLPDGAAVTLKLLKRYEKEVSEKPWNEVLNSLEGWILEVKKVPDITSITGPKVVGKVDEFILYSSIDLTRNPSGDAAAGTPLNEDEFVLVELKEEGTPLNEDEFVLVELKE